MPGPIEEGQEFVDFAAFKVAMQDWAVGGAHKFTFRYQRSDATRNVVICAHQDCPFRVSATFNKTLGCVKVAKVEDEHICVGVAPVRQTASSNQAWLRRILPTIITITKNTTPTQIRDAVKLHHQVAISYDAAKRAKKYLLGDDLEVQAAQFQLLPAYTNAIRSADPNARVVLSIENREGTQRFQRIFICPGVSRSAFEHSRHMIAMDGTFTKDIFSLTILHVLMPTTM